MRAVQEDVISYFKEDPDTLIDKYLQFAMNLEEFNKGNIYDWLVFLKSNKLEDVTDEHIMDNLNRLFHLFFLDQKDNGFLLQYKNDYFD